MRSLTLVVLALCAVFTHGRVVQKESIWQDYHVEFGIPEAARIKAAEEADLLSPSTRITGGSLAELGQFPYQVGLVIALVDGETSVCGGSLLSNTRVATAAHCWRHLSTIALSFTVVLGSVTLFSGGTRIVTRDVEQHANFTTSSLANDVAIARIAFVDYTEYIQPIALASGNDNFAGVIARASGFGIVSDFSQIVASQRLSFVDLPVITNAQCEENYITILDSTLCVSGAEGRSTCFGDSGGPLVVDTADGLRQIGIVSFGSRRCTIGIPTGFARASSFHSWFTSRL